MDFREYQSSDEMTIDLAHLVASLLKKWRSLVLLTIVGAMLGAAMQWVPQLLPQKKAPVRSRKDAALVEKMNAAAAARTPYEELKRYIDQSAFMQLDSQSVFSGASEYYATGCQDPNQIAAAFEAISSDRNARNALCEILGISNEMDLDKMVSLRASVQTTPKIVGEMRVDLQEKACLFIDIYAVTEERAQQVLDYLDEAVQQLPMTVVPKQKFEITEISRSVKQSVQSELRAEQNKILEEMVDAYAFYMGYLEEDFSPKEYALYETYFLTGKVNELPIDLFPSNPLKKAILIAFVFAFLGCTWYAVAYLLSGKVKTPEDVTASTGRNLLAFIDTGKPRKLALDRAIEKMENHSFPQPATVNYIAAAIEKLGKSVVVYDRRDEILRETAQRLSSRIPCMGLLSQDAETMNALQKDTQVIILVRAAATTKGQLQQESALYSLYGVPLAGSILVK